MTELFDSVYTQTTAAVEPKMLFLSLMTSLILGAALAWVYKYRTFYTKEFVVTLILLPSIISLIIFLVNGSLGTSVAVAGTFSLVRFRSAAGGSRELLSLFLSMAVGLTVGMGYLLLALLSTLVFLIIWRLMEKFSLFNNQQTRRYLTVEVPKEKEEEMRISTILKNSCSSSDLISVSSSKEGSYLRLDYEVDLKSGVDDYSLTNQLLHSVNRIDLSLTKKPKKKKNL